MVRSVVVWVGGVGFCLLMLAHLCLPDVTRPVIWLHALAAWIPLGAVPLVFFVRRWREALPLALVAAAWLAVVWPSPGADPVGASPPFRVVSSNALFDNPRLDALVAEWREVSPDVLLIQEYSPAVEASMLSLRRQYPFRVELPQPGAFGIAVFSRWPIDNTHTVQLGPVPMLQADVHVRGKTVSIWNVHTLPPLFEGADDVWAAQLDQLAEAMATHPGPLVVAGDFNLTRHHSHYRGLTAVADDAYGRCGRWLAATWPTEELSPTGPLVKLDHLFLKGPIRCRTLREGANPGSDHRSIMATLGW